ncbi:MAG: GC-type dockerin domain-anchored protein [Phycisphaerales bacterium]
MSTRRSFRVALLAAAVLAPLGAVPLTTAAPPVVNGWSQFTPSPDSRIVYVSSSTGNDANNGLSQSSPKRTLSAAYSVLRHGYPDWMLLKSGDTWTESFPGWGKSGRSDNEMMRIGSYGAGARPKLQTGTSNGIYAFGGSPSIGHIAITDLHMVPHTYDGSNGVPSGIQMLANCSDILVENCYFERFFQNIIFNSNPATESMSDIRIRRCVSVDAFRIGSGHAQGMYIGGANNVLLEECAFDHNGWSESIGGADPTIFRHNIYIQSDCSNVTTRGLISARAAATGMQQRPGGTCEGHLFLRNPLGIVMGGGGTVRNCVLMDSRDIDAANPRGVGIQIAGGNTFEVAGNVCSWRTQPGTWNIQAISVDSTSHTVNIHDNVVWKWSVQGANSCGGLQIGGAPSGTFQVRNNHLQMRSGGMVIENNVSYPLGLSGNRYYSPQSNPFERSGVGMNFTQWVIATSETGASFTPGTYPDPDRSISTYMSSIGRPPTLEAFMAEARLQSKSNWRPQFTAAAVNAYIKAGYFGGTSPPACPADLNGDLILNLNDMIAFQKFFFRSDMRADVNHDGVLNIADFTTYQTLYNAGCP